MVWYSHVSKNFPQFVVIYTVKGFSVVNKDEVDVFLEFSCFCYDPMMLAIWSLVPLPFLNPAWTFGSSRFMYCWRLTWRILNITLLACEMSAILQKFEHSLALPFFGIFWENWPFPVLWPLLNFPNFLAYWVQYFSHFKTINPGQLNTCIPHSICQGKGSIKEADVV